MIFLSIHITAKEPVKVGLQLSQNGSGSFSYLPGSTIRGTVIGSLLKSDPSIQVDDLLRKVFFDPAYPCAMVNGKEAGMFPVPPVYFATKHEVRKAHGNAFQVTLSEKPNFDHRNAKGEAQKSAGLGKFGTIQDGKILTFDTEKTAKLHIATAQSRAGKTMFRYEAIEKGQTFLGFVRTEDEVLADRIVSDINDTDFFIGGSRSAGYGRCHVSVAKLGDEIDRKSLYGLKEKEQGKLLAVYALSDILLLDDNGMETGIPDPSYLKNKLHLASVKFLGAQLTSRETLGFNHTWKAGPENRGAIEAGSIWYYEIEGTPDSHAERELENEGIGLRRNEGYGTILINPDFAADAMSSLKPDETKNGGQTLENIDPQTLEMLQAMQERINRNRMNRMMRIEALKCAKKNKGLTDKFSPTQIMCLLSLLESILQNEGADTEINDRYKVQRFRKDLKTGTKDMYDTTEIVLDRSHNTRWKLSEALDKLTEDNVSFNAYAGDFATVQLVNLTGDSLQARREFYKKAEYLYLVLYDLIRKEGAEK